jgi:hypothetical protein
MRAREDLLDRERLRDVVLRAAAQAAQPRRQLALLRQEDEGDVRAVRKRLHRFEEAPAVHSRHHDVRDDQIGPLMLDERDRLPGVASGARLEPLAEKASDRMSSTSWLSSTMRT